MPKQPNGTPSKKLSEPPVKTFAVGFCLNDFGNCPRRRVRFIAVAFHA
jgi:hypothetical protein